MRERKNGSNRKTLNKQSKHGLKLALLIFPNFRVYTEKYNEEQLMLYITNIQTSDAGDYTCRGNAGGQPVEKKVTLTIYSKSRISCLLCV